MNEFLMFLERNPVLSVILAIIIFYYLACMFDSVFSRKCKCQCHKKNEEDEDDE